MSNLPKLKVNKLPSGEEIRDFEQGKYLPFCDYVLVLVEGEIINSYEELVQLAAQDCYKDKEFLEVTLMPLVMGGG